MRHVPGVCRVVRSGQGLLGELPPSEGSNALLELSLLITEREVHRCLLTYVGSSVSVRMRKPAVRPGVLACAVHNLSRRYVSAPKPYRWAPLAERTGTLPGVVGAVDRCRDRSLQLPTGGRLPVDGLNKHALTCLDGEGRIRDDLSSQPLRNRKCLPWWC